MGERREFDVVVHVDRQRRGERCGGVLLALIGEFLGHGAEIGVEDAVQPGLPGGREFASVAVFRGGGDHRVGIGFDHGVDLVEVGFVVAVVQSRIDLLGDDAVALDAAGHVVGLAADGEVQRTVEPDVFHRFFEVDVAHDPHLREVQFGTSGAEDLAFEERQGRVAPAGAAAALVFHGGDGHDLNVGETVALRSGRFGRLCRGSSCETERECGENEVFHGMTGFRCRYFFDPATIFRHSSRVSSSGLAPFGRR